MATDVQVPTTGSGVVPYRLTVRQFEKMIDAGVFPEGAHVELLCGLLVDKMTKHTPHNFTVGELGDGLRRIVPPGWYVDEEKPIETGEIDRPEPDIAVIRGSRRDYREHPPGAANIAMIIEVADSSYRKDRGLKWRRYASAGVLTYWIVNIPARRVEVYTDPSGRGQAAAYRKEAIYAEDAAVPVVIEGDEVGRIAVRDILP